MDQDWPHTRESLARDLAELGLAPRQTVLLHSSLRRLGWVCGGASAVVSALLDVLGTGGTLVVPTQTNDNSEPSRWSYPPVPESWWQIIRDQMPGFDPAITPSKDMGAIAEQTRTWPGAVRSAHPQTSFAAVGARASDVVATHALDCRLGSASPLGTLAEMDAVVLLLGVAYDSCTCFHLAEYRVPNPPLESTGAAVLSTTGSRRWVTGTDVATDDDDFVAIGEDLEATGAVRLGTVGSSLSRLFSLPQAVAHATTWMEAHRVPA